MILAIVGSTKLTPDQEREVRLLIANKVLRIGKDNIERVVSGGARGVDSIAASLCRRAGMEVREFLPENQRWAPYGFKDRNKFIAEACDELLCIRSERSKTYGSGWTADYAESIGKKVERVKV